MVPTTPVSALFFLSRGNKDSENLARLSAMRWKTPGHGIYYESNPRRDHVELGTYQPDYVDARVILDSKAEAMKRKGTRG